MFNILKSELYRVFKGKMIYVFMLITALLPALSLLFIHLFSEEAVASGLLVPDFNQGVFFSQNPIEFITGGLGILFALLLGVSLLAEEYQIGMLKMRLLISERLYVYLAKVITVFICFSLLSCVHGFMSYILGGIFYGFNMDADMAFHGLLGFVLTFQTVAIVSVGFMGLGMLFKKTSSAIGVGIGVILVWSILMNILSDTWLWLVPHAYVIKALAIDLDAFGYSALMTLSVYLILGLAFGYIHFARKDLTS